MTGLDYVFLPRSATPNLSLCLKQARLRRRVGLTREFGPSSKCELHDRRKKVRRDRRLSIKRIGPRSAMWRTINALYEDYCQARLDEKLKLDVVK